MADSFPVTLIVGTLMGILAGLGVGGGSILILWLTLVLNIPHTVAKGINLLFFIPAATISCIMRRRQGKLNIKIVIPAMAAGAASALLFTWLATKLPTDIMRIPFGILLLVTGIREILYRPRKDR